MSIVAHDNKVVTAGGKALSYDTLIALANATTGENDKTLAAAVNRLIDGYGGIYSVTSGTFTLTQPRQDVLIPFVLPAGKKITAVFAYADKEEIESIFAESGIVRIVGASASVFCEATYISTTTQGGADKNNFDYYDAVTSTYYDNAWHGEYYGRKTSSFDCCGYGLYAERGVGVKIGSYYSTRQYAPGIEYKYMIVLMEEP